MVWKSEEQVSAFQGRKHFGVDIKEERIWDSKTYWKAKCTGA